MAARKAGEWLTPDELVLPGLVEVLIATGVASVVVGGGLLVAGLVLMGQPGRRQIREPAPTSTTQVSGLVPADRRDGGTDLSSRAQAVA